MSRADIVEVRLDTFPAVALPGAIGPVFAADLVRYARRQSRLPVLATCRWPREARGSLRRAGRLNRSPASPLHRDALRRSILEAVIRVADLVDLEIRNRAVTLPLTRLARRRGVAVVHSYHRFAGPAQPRETRRLAALSRRLGGDFFKVAVPADSPQDAEAFLAWAADLPHPRLVLIAMGAAGRPSRVLGYCFGSRFTYGHLGRSAAPGQIPAAELARVVRAVYPSGRAEAPRRA